MTCLTEPVGTERFRILNWDCLSLSGLGGEEGPTWRGSARFVGRTDDVGLELLVLFFQEKRTGNALLFKRNRPKPPRPPAIRLVLLAEVAAEAPLFAAHLHQHDDHNHAEHQQGLPGPEAHDGADIIDETARQHGVAAQAVGTFRHQMLRARRHLMPEGIHGVAVALAPHVDDTPHAQRQPEHGQHDGCDQSRQRSVQGVGHP